MGTVNMSVFTRLEDHVFVITLGGSGITPWGTALEEHRINPGTVAALEEALDTALAHDSVQAVLVRHEGKFFSNGMDLKYIEANPGEATHSLQVGAERLMAKLLTFPVPTVAAIKGHFTAAGAMLGLSFDKRVMRADRGYFFVPAIDIGLVYSPGQTELMKAKTPQSMHVDTLAFAKRYTAKDLHPLGVVDQIAPEADVDRIALEMAKELCAKGKNALYRQAMHGIKKNLYSEAYRLLTSNTIQGMGFENKPIGVDRAPTLTAKL